jgi:hypothetical protein
VRENTGFGTTGFGTTGFGITGFGQTGFGATTVGELVEAPDTRAARGSWFGKLTAVLPR